MADSGKGDNYWMYFECYPIFANDDDAGYVSGEGDKRTSNIFWAETEEQQTLYG